MEQRARRVPVLLAPREYEVLKSLAESEERTPVQQAAYIVRRSLATRNAGDPAGGRDDRGPEAA
jgi:hypothetical protein